MARLRYLTEEEAVEVESVEETEAEVRNVKWMLVVSLVIFIFTFYSMTGYIYYPYPYVAKDFWYYLNLINALF